MSIDFGRRAFLLPLRSVHLCPDCTVFSERELTFTFAICYRRSVCRLPFVFKKTFVRSTQPVKFSAIFSSPFDTLAILWHPRKILRRSSCLLAHQPKKTTCQNAQLFTWHLPLCSKSWLHLWGTSYLIWPNYIYLQSLLLSHSSTSFYPA